MKKQCFFITGTGTDIGKTFVTAGIALKAIEAGIKTALVKPVQTGTDDYPSDVETIDKIINGLFPLPRKVAVPFEFRFAASPHLAAELEGKCIDAEDVVDACRIAEKIPGPELLLFEGAGGLFVPLNEKDTMLDLIAALDFPVILVCPVGLGAINYAMLSIMALRGFGINIAGLVFNGMPQESDVIADDNVKTIARMSGLPVLAVIPQIEKDQVNQATMSVAFAGLSIADLTS